MDVRPARAADIGPIAALDQTAQSDPRRAEEISRAVSAGGCHVAIVDGSIAGYAVFRADFFNQGFVWLLGVAENRRRRGVGNALMAAIERACPTAKLFTSTNRSNTPMRSLLTRRGYTEVGVVDGLDEGDPEVFFMKHLS